MKYISEENLCSLAHTLGFTVMKDDGYYQAYNSESVSFLLGKEDVAGWILEESGRTIDKYGRLVPIA